MNIQSTLQVRSAALLLAALLLLTPFTAIAQDSAEAARTEAAAIIRAAQDEAAQIRANALTSAAQIEADAMRRAAEIEAEAIRNAALQRVPSSPVIQNAPPPPAVVNVGSRYPNLTGVWAWKGNARNKKFEVVQHGDMSVTTKLWKTPRTRLYREDLHYKDGVLVGRIHHTVKTQTGNDDKRWRDFQMSISPDGQRLVGTIIETTDKSNRERRLDVVWERLRR